MNILIVSAVFYPEPIVIGTLSRDIALRLAEKHTVTVVCPKPTRPFGYDFSDYRYEKDKTYTRVELQSYTCAKTDYIGRFRETYGFGRAVKKYLDANYKNFDVVYSWSWPLYAQLLIAKAAKKYKIPLITHVQDVYPEPFLRRVPIIGRLLYRLFFNVDKKSLLLSEKVIAIAPRIKEYLIHTRGLNRKQVEVIYNWQDETRFENYTAQRKPLGSPFTFMFLGTLSGAANLEYIANCFLKADIPNSQFIFAGSGSAKKNLENIAKQDKNKRIEFCDAPFSEVAKIQDRADVLVISLNKGGGAHAFPSKLPAYMFSKKPVLASVDASSDIAFVIKEARCGWVVEPKQQENLIERMRSISKYPEDKLAKMGANGLSYCQGNLSKKVNLEKLCTIIESVYNGGK